MAKSIRNLVVVLGDQLDQESAALEHFDKQADLVWMAEVAGESTHVWSHKARTVLFLSAMRHFNQWLTGEGYSTEYRKLDARGNQGTIALELSAAIKKFKPEKLVVVRPGTHRLLEDLEAVAESESLKLEVREDSHFFCGIGEFAEHAQGRKQLRMEYFYREMRKKHGVLMSRGKPIGGKWNYDADNRASFSKKTGPVGIEPATYFEPDEITLEVIALVVDKFSDHPGSLDNFDWPVTPEQAIAALNDFVENRLPRFGLYQDAMWSDEPFLNHSLLAAAMNLKLLNPRTVIAAAESAYQRGQVPLAGVEGFIRQILGWREYVRGVYWHFMPEYIERNELGAKQNLPEFYWTGETEMNCLSQAIGQTLEHGYAHHIQRLMVTGLFSLLLGVHPKQIHEWYLAVYVDAVEWVELPNTLGMSQYADGGVMASKPYVATGKYIQRMSNYCKGCQYNPAESVGDSACPFTTLYWDFLQTHRERLAKNNRMVFQVKNLERKKPEELVEIQKQAKAVRAKCCGDES